MSLLDDFGRKCVLLEKTRVPDGAGGWITTWAEGAEFLNYQKLETSVEARIAEQQGVPSIYTGRVKRDFPIAYGDYFRDTEIDATYRVTSHPEENVAPASSTFDMKLFTAERKAVPG